MEQEQKFLVQFNFQAMLRLDVGCRDARRIAGILDLDEGELLRVIAEFDEACVAGAKQVAQGVDVQACAQRQATIVFVGDSCTSDRLSYMNILKQVFRDCPGIRLIDSAVSGWRSGDILQDYAAKVLDYKPDIVVYAMGLNDMRKICGTFNTTSLAEFQRNIRTALQGLGNAKAVVNTMSPTHAARIEKSFGQLDWTFPEEDWQAYNRALCEAAQHCGAALNDTRALFAQAIQNGVDVFYEDGLHMSEEGQKLVAKSLLGILVQMIQEIE